MREKLIDQQAAYKLMKTSQQFQYLKMSEQYIQGQISHRRIALILLPLTLNEQIYLQPMSQFRDIQRLRHTRVNNHQYPGLINSARNSQASNFQSSNYQYSQKYTQYNPNFYNLDRHSERQSSRQSSTKLAENYGKISTSKQLQVRSRQRRHKRNQSNGFNYEPKKESDVISSGLSIYNFTMKMNSRPQNHSNPLTSRKERHEISEFEMMPEAQTFFSNLQTNSKNSTNLGQFRAQQSSKIMKQKPIEEQHISKSFFKILYPIGKGGFGKVWKVQTKKTSEILAMKEMYKAKIIQKKSINSVMNEKNILAKLKHPFIINMHSAFQDRQNLYLIMDYLDGGDLRYHIGKRRRFNESQTKFFMANMIIGLQYLHSHKIIHRDMKPENMVFDSVGYLRITDMGISREMREENHQDTSGTPGYMSPEVICRNNHTYAADYFALGVMGYEFMFGKRPYNGRNRKQIRDQILSKQAIIRQEDIPPRWQPQAADFINKLLQRNPKNRLGFNGASQVKKHQWMANINWQSLKRKQIRAPYIPESIQDNYEEYKEQISEDTVDENLEQNLLMLRNKQVQNLFQGYSFQKSSQDSRKSSYTTSYTQGSSNKY